jgi:hypothetical protein
MRNELQKASNALNLSAKERTDAKKLLADSEADRARLQERVSSEEVLRRRAEAELERVRNELRETMENLSMLSLQCDQVGKSHEFTKSSSHKYMLLSSYSLAY